MGRRKLPVTTWRGIAGGHLCLLYEDREQQFAAVVPFIRHGLTNREKCLYIVADSAVEEVEQALRAARINVESYLASGQLCVSPPAQPRSRQRYVDPE